MMQPANTKLAKRRALGYARTPAGLVLGIMAVGCVTQSEARQQAGGLTRQIAPIRLVSGSGSSATLAPREASQTSHATRSDERHTERPLAALARQISDRLSGRDRIAVLDLVDVDGEKTQLGAFVAEELITCLHGMERCVVVERRFLSSLLGELALSLGPLVDETTAQELGRLLGVTAIVSGTITDLNRTARINARIMSAETGAVLGAASTSLVMDEAMTRLAQRPLASSGPSDKDHPQAAAVESQEAEREHGAARRDVDRRSPTPPAAPRPGPRRAKGDHQLGAAQEKGHTQRPREAPYHVEHHRPSIRVKNNLLSNVTILYAP